MKPCVSRRFSSRRSASPEPPRGSEPGAFHIGYAYLLPQQRCMVRHADCWGQRYRKAVLVGRRAFSANQCSILHSRSAGLLLSLLLRPGLLSLPVSALLVVDKSYTVSFYRRWCAPCP